MDAPPHEALERFERGFDPLAPGRARGATIVGFGEISVVLSLDAHPGWVLKRVAGLSGEESGAYRALVAEYVAALEARGVVVAPTETVEVRRDGRTLVYVLQRALPADRLAPRFARGASDEALRELLGAVLEATERTVRPRGGSHLGLDAQLSNWALARDGAPRELVYLDVTTPLLRAHGADRLDVAFLLRALPAPLAWAMRRTGAPAKMMGRYFAPRTVALDVVSNLYKEGCAARVPLALEVVNAWLARAGHRALDAREVRADYRDDARMWAVLQWVKRPDRWVRTRVLRQPYDWVLPPSIDRRTKDAT
ncbi:MAG: hypothetical protein KF729_30685 [Sandaracinaceae bacterium]|nr:hypothetical protein [Sandaracinaceae bacterium]